MRPGSTAPSPFPPPPAGAPAEAGPARRETVVERRPAYAPRRLDLAERPVHVVEQAERLGRPFAEVAPVALEGHEAADVDLPQIHRGVAIDDPVGDRPAGSTTGLEADRVEAGGHEHPGHGPGP